MIHESLLYDMLSPGTDTVNLRGPDNNERIFSEGYLLPRIEQGSQGHLSPPSAGDFQYGEIRHGSIH